MAGGYVIVSSNKTFVTTPPPLLGVLTPMLFPDVIGWLAQELNETGGGGMIQWFNMDSEDVNPDVDGELIGDISLGDKESILSTPLSASDIGAAIIFEACGEENKVLVEAKELLQDPEAVGYGGGGSMVEGRSNGC